MSNLKIPKCLNPVQLKPGYVKLEETKKFELSTVKKPGYVKFEETKKFEPGTAKNLVMLKSMGPTILFVL
jgi:hypothetical protein